MPALGAKMGRSSSSNALWSAWFRPAGSFLPPPVCARSRIRPDGIRTKTIFRLPQSCLTILSVGQAIVLTYQVY